MVEDKEEVVKEEPNIEIVDLSDDTRRNSANLARKYFDSVSLLRFILLHLHGFFNYRPNLEFRLLCDIHRVI